MKSFINFIDNKLSIIFNWAVLRSDRPRKRSHNLFYNLLAFICDLSLMSLHLLISLYYKYTNPYGMFSSEEDS